MDSDNNDRHIGDEAIQVYQYCKKHLHGKPSNYPYLESTKAYRMYNIGKAILMEMEEDEGSDIYYLISEGMKDLVALDYLSRAFTKCSSVHRREKLYWLLIDLVVLYKKQNVKDVRSLAKSAYLYATKKIGRLPDSDRSIKGSSYYVYIAKDETGLVRYVGKGKGSRVNHINSGTSHNFKINEYFFSGGKLTTHLVEVGLDESIAILAEKTLINRYKESIWNKAL